MNSSFAGLEWHAKTVRGWQLAILRFAVTLDNADRLAVMAIASEIDRLGPPSDSEPNFSFFRRTSTELCVAILRPNELSPAVLRQYVAQIDDDRLRRAFAATIEAERSKTSVRKPVERDSGIWKGLSLRGSHRL
jgi:hypothetical protein